MKRALVMKPNDSVAVCIQDVLAGEEVETILGSITANEDIPMPHKIAAKDILFDEPVLKYENVIGYATKEIKKGDWIHTHNVSPVNSSERVVTR